jgi:hypothetical protein
MSIFLTISNIENDENLHLGRLLILLEAFKNKSAKIDSFSKLAELDFLLRYPVYLERAIPARGKSSKVSNVDVTDYERYSIESMTVAYNHRPWDDQYRRFIKILLAKNLIYIEIDEKKFHFSLTTKGHEIASCLSRMDAYSTVEKRVIILKKDFNLSSDKLIKFLYETFPELGILGTAEGVSHEN